MDSAVLRGWHSFAAAFVLVLSLAIKLAVQDVAIGENPASAVEAIANALRLDGFVVSATSSAPPVVKAARGNCTLIARVLDPHGTFRDTALSKFPRGWPVTYVWRGSWRQSLPRLGPLIEYYVQREMARIGIAASRAPVIMVARQPGCTLPVPDFVDLRLRQSAISTVGPAPSPARLIERFPIVR